MGDGSWTVWPPVILSGSAFIPIFMLGGFFPVLQDDLHTTAGFLGLVVSLFYLSSTMGYATCAAVVDSLPAHAVIRCGIMLIGLACALIAWPGTAPNALIPAALVAGAGHSLVQTAGNAWLSRSASRPAFMFGVKQSAASAAGMIAGMLVALAQPAQWRVLFVGVGVAIGLSAALIRRPVTSPHTAEAMARRPIPISLWPSAFVALLGAGVALATSSYLAASIVDLDFEVAFAGRIIFAASLVCVLSRLALGRMLDRSPETARAACAATWLLGAGGFLLLAARQPSSLLTVAAAVLACGIGWAWTGALLYTVSREYPASPGRVTGLIQTAAAAGGMAGPLLAGLSIERWGYRVVWTACAGLVLCAAVVVTIRPRPHESLSAAP